MSGFGFNLVEPWYLLGLLALAVPVIVHLIARRQTRLVQLGTIRFLREVVKHNARRRQVKRWLLLALRCAAVLLFVGMFARPFWRNQQPAETNRFVAILIDKSSSMSIRDEGRRAIDRAVSAAERVIADAGERADIEAAFFDLTVQPIAPPAGTGTPRLRSLPTPEALPRAGSYTAALEWARDVCQRHPQPRKDVYLFTDLQRSGLDWTSFDPFPEGVTLHVRDVGRGNVNNPAITSARASRTLVRPGEPLTISTTVLNSSPLTKERLPVVLTLTSGARQQRVRGEVTVSANAAADIDLELPALEAGLWRGFVELEVEDDLAFDNLRHVAVLAAPPIPILIVQSSEAEAAIDETYLLDRALRLATEGESSQESPFVPEGISLDSTALPDLSDFRVVVLANCDAITPASAARLREFVDAGGGLLVFTGERVTAKSTSSLVQAGLVPGEIGPIIRANELPDRWTSWNLDHPLFEPFRDPQYGDLGRLGFDSHTALKPQADANVLANFQDGSPGLVELQVGKGRVLWFLSTCSREWTDWPRSRLYLPLVHQLAGDLAGLTGGGPIRQVVLETDGARDTSLTTGVVQRSDHLDVINGAPRESETERCTAKEIGEKFQVAVSETDAQAPELEKSAVNLAGVSFRPTEFWHYLAYALLVVLIVESFVGNRTPVTG